MKKKLLIGICILLVIVCLIPRCEHYEDGGTVAYKAILYQVKYVHSIGADDPSGGEYLEGTIVKILGIEVYNDVEAAETRQEIVEEDSIPTDAEPPYEEPISGAPPVEYFSSAKEAVKEIIAVKEAGVEKMSHPGDFRLYEKDYLYFLKEAPPLPGYTQEAVVLILEGTEITYRNSENNGLAIFYWFEGYENNETVEERTKRFGLTRYKDTKFFFGKKFDDLYIFWWEDGDEFSFMYPADSNVLPEEIIEYLEVEKYVLD